ncbi:pilus assembly protein [Aggregicoccus sp. 17bor-14]|nr:pilus assembly protein [Simulacricoccus sp. 17bor-14]MRI91286.1 pilus assembly protein [Aggregicoccus sp. 17bor-14]
MLRMGMSRAGAQRGQVAVEAALVLPLMTFMVLGIIQLTMMQHAKLMTEYAAYQAARAGIVWNGNNERMHDAAVVALLPTLGRTDDVFELGKTWALHKGWDLAMRQLQMGKGKVIDPAAFNGSNLFGFIRVDTIRPSLWDPIGSIWKLRAGANWKELDFDGADTYPEIPGFEDKIRKFFNLPEPDSSEVQYRKATLLQIRLRYWYELTVPFANWVIFTAWFASNSDVALSGGIDKPTVEPGANMTADGNLEPLGSKGKGIAHNQGYDSVYPTEMVVLWRLSQGTVPLLSRVVGKKYFIPLTATQSMRMQSNFHKKWIMHINPDWNL